MRLVVHHKNVLYVTSVSPALAHSGFKSWSERVLCGYQLARVRKSCCIDSSAFLCSAQLPFWGRCFVCIILHPSPPDHRRCLVLVLVSSRLDGSLSLSKQPTAAALWLFGGTMLQTHTEVQEPAKAVFGGAKRLFYAEVSLSGVLPINSRVVAATP